MYNAMVITVSDRCYNKIRVDESGPVVEKILKDNGYNVIKSIILPDEKEMIVSSLKNAAKENINLIITTGGTGLAPRDITPEATLAVCEKIVPGIPELMRYEPLKITKRAALSRAVCGICKKTLILNLPGSPKAAKENLEAVLSLIDHSLFLLKGETTDCSQIKY